MRSRFILAASAAMAFMSCTAAEARTGTTQQTAAAEDLSLRQVQAVLDAFVKAGTAPGVSAAIGRGTAPPVFLQSGRISDDPDAPKAGPDSLWRIYSMTKPITAAAAMMLIEDGKIKLDQPISDFIPAFKTMRVLEAPESSLASRPAKQVITIRHLLTHTGGLTYQIINMGPITQEYARLGVLGGRADPEATKSQPKGLAEFADRVASLPLVAEPGSQWNYSIGLDVLGRLIEVASGKTFDRFVQERLLDPLGMKSTYWTVPRSEANRLATSYAFAEGRRIPIEAGATSAWLTPPTAHYGGSGLVSSARDYDRFLQMLAGQGAVGSVRVLRPETVKLAMSNLLPVGVRISGKAIPDTTRAEGHGAGGWLYLEDVPEGVGAGTYGWFGAAGTIGFIDPKHGLRVSVMVNHFAPNKWTLHRNLVQALYSKLPEPPCICSATGKPTDTRAR